MARYNVIFNIHKCVLLTQEFTLKHSFPLKVRSRVRTWLPESFGQIEPVINNYVLTFRAINIKSIIHFSRLLSYSFKAQWLLYVNAQGSLYVITPGQVFHQFLCFSSGSAISPLPHALSFIYHRLCKNFRVS